MTLSYKVQEITDTIKFMENAINISTTANTELRAEIKRKDEEIADLKSNLKKLRGFAKTMIEHSKRWDPPTPISRSTTIQKAIEFDCLDLHEQPTKLLQNY